MTPLVVRSTRVVLPDGTRPAALFTDRGRIVAVRPHSDWPQGSDFRRIDAGELMVLPGVVDSHVHINEPGRTDWEGFAHATRAAIAGGVTTLVDMPLNCIPSTTTVAALDEKRKTARGQCFADVGFWGGVVPGNAAEIGPLARAGVLGFKCFLAPSGVIEFEHVGEADLRLAMPAVARTGLPLLVHAELPALLRDPVGDAHEYSTWLESRPPAAESAAIELVIRLARETSARVHIVHLASAEPLALIAQARADGVHLTVETCPHYLTFAAEDIPSRATLFKCAPPIRGSGERDRLWAALADEVIDLVATDHSPAPPSTKQIDSGDFLRAWGGIASLQVALGAVWTGARARGLGPELLARWMSAAPAKLAGLAYRKGSLAVGHDADLVIWDPDATSRVDAAQLYSRHRITPYAGSQLFGRVKQTLLRGEVVFDDIRGIDETARGQLLGPL